MQQITLVRARSSRLARLFRMQTVLLCIGLFWSVVASAAHTSLECPAQSGTVSNGGTVSVNVTDCATSIAFAGIGAVDGPALPAHGTAILRITGPNWFVDYSHNGNSATSDVFEFTDGTVASNTVRVAITISPPASPVCRS